MSARFHRLLAYTFLLVVSQFSVASTPTTWPASPSRLHLSTPYGTLNIAPSEYVYESRLQINDQDISPAISGILNITHAYSMPQAQIALISISNGDNACPVVYRWVVLQKSGYKLTPEFGSCSELIKVSAKGRLFTLQTPSAQKPDKIDIYTYDGNTIRHRLAP